MVDPSQEPATRKTADETSGSATRAGVPRWVKAGFVALVVVLLFVIMHLVAGPGGHGPGSHFGGQAPPVGVSAPDGPSTGGIG
ncbi:hypothetical protein ABZ568_11695 [Streptomyces olindensis]|uniref:Uncharacterized protein n=1 Tax=Streptomyces olindensis TaxID=358823 RepID=A0ABV2XSU8_9ACTN